jgi:hypothetical protein
MGFDSSRAPDTWLESFDRVNLQRLPRTPRIADVGPDIGRRGARPFQPAPHVFASPFKPMRLQAAHTGCHA